METTLNTLKNLYAQEQGYEDWADLYRRSGYYDEKVFFMHEDAAIVLAEKAALEKAAENAMVNFCHKEIKKEITDDYGQTYWVHEESITNPENLIR